MKPHALMAEVRNAKPSVNEASFTGQTLMRFFRHISAARDVREQRITELAQAIEYRHVAHIGATGCNAHWLSTSGARGSNPSSAAATTATPKVNLETLASSSNRPAAGGRQRQRLSGRVGIRKLPRPRTLVAYEVEHAAWIR